MSVVGPMARNVPDLAMLLSVQAGFDPRVPLSLDGDGSVFQRRLESIQGQAHCLVGGFQGHAAFEAGVLEVCRKARTDPRVPRLHRRRGRAGYSILTRVAGTIRLRGWQPGGPRSRPTTTIRPSVRCSSPRRSIEVETGMRQSASDITAASVLRTEWSQTVRRFFERYDYFIVAHRAMFPFDINLHWPQEIAGQKMQTYHEWMKCTLLVTMAAAHRWPRPPASAMRGCRSAFKSSRPCTGNSRVLQLAFGYDTATSWSAKRLPALLEGLLLTVAASTNHGDHPRSPLIWLLGALLLMWCVGMFGRGYWTPDEPREADIAWRMSWQADKAVPLLAGKPSVKSRR